MRAALRKVLLLLAVPAVLVVSVLTSSGSAFAGGTGGSTSGGGYTVSASATVTSGGGGSIPLHLSVSVPASCWWSVDDEVPDPNDPVAVKKWWEETMPTINGTFEPGQLMYGTVEMYDAAIAAAKAGQKITFYVAHCRDTADVCALNKYAGAVNAPPGWNVPGCPGIAQSVRFFPTGNPPVPAVDPHDLAIAAWDQLKPPSPQIDRNPKVGSVGGGTLVGLDTWFWVTNPDSVGGTTGERRIRVTAGTAWAELTATTGGLTIDAPNADGGDCTPAQALKQYTPGASPSSGCTVTFTRASVGYGAGYPVSASASWTATWRGSDGNGGALDAVTPAAAAVNVPVAESQAIVSSAK